MSASRPLDLSEADRDRSPPLRHGGYLARIFESFRLQCDVVCGVPSHRLSAVGRRAFLDKNKVDLC